MSEEPTNTFEFLLDEYTRLRPTLDEFVVEFGRQLEKLLEQENVSLAVPLQSRIKDWDSIQEKIERKSWAVKSIRELTDLVGVRAILLFNREVDTVAKLLGSEFHVLEQENTRERLQETQFGYASIHLLISLPDKWLAAPSLAKFGRLIAEVQVRTMAQHIWAAASHTLQYKQETSVPPPVRRAIHRVSALLETVDLELERILDQRDQYQQTEAMPTATLNVDVLEQVLDKYLPVQNKAEVETYADLLVDLNHFSIFTLERLTEILAKHRDAMLGMDIESVEAIRADESLLDLLSSDRDRLNRGVYFTHVGLTRVGMALEYRDEWDRYFAVEDV